MVDVQVGFQSSHPEPMTHVAALQMPPLILGPRFFSPQYPHSLRHGQDITQKVK